MANYDTYGYDAVRSFVQSNWNWLAVLNDSGTELLRWDLTSNANVTLESDATANPLEYTVTVTGQDLVDAGYALPQTLSELELYETDAGGTPVGQDPVRDSSGTATTATLEADTDTVDITFTQAWPP